MQSDPPSDRLCPGVVCRDGVDLVRERGPRPTWTAALSEVTETLDVPAPYAAGWQTRVPIVEMPIYLQWLAARVRDLGGTLTRMALPHLPRLPQRRWIP